MAFTATPNSRYIDGQNILFCRKKVCFLRIKFNEARSLFITTKLLPAEQVAARCLLTEKPWFAENS